MVFSGGNQYALCIFVIVKSGNEMSTRYKK